MTWPKVRRIMAICIAIAFALILVWGTWGDAQEHGDCVHSMRDQGFTYEQVNKLCK